MAGGYYERVRDAEWQPLAAEQPALHMHTVQVALLDAKALDRRRLWDHIEARLARVPRARQRLVQLPRESRPGWVDDEHFLLDYHLRHSALPPPGDETELKRLVARIASQQLDRGKPLWELWVVEGVAQERLALVEKIHLALGESLLPLLLDPSPEAAPVEPRVFVPRPAPAPAELLVAQLARSLSAPLAWLGELPGSLPGPSEWPGALGRSLEWVADSLVDAVLPRQSRTPANGGPHRHCDWLAIDRARVDDLQERHGVRAIDVLLAVTLGALRTWLTVRGEELPRRGVCAFVSGPDGVGEWVELPLEEKETEGEPDAARRLTQVANLTARMEALPDPLALAARPFARPGFPDSAPPRSLALALRMSAARAPRETLYLAGAQLERTYALPPLGPGERLAMALTPCGSQVFWTLHAEPAGVPDLALLADALVANLNALRTTGA